MTDCVMIRRDCGDKENEEEVSQMGPVHQLERNIVTAQAIAPKYCAPL